MEEALRSCMEQLVMAREEREQIIVEAANEISSGKKKMRELQHKLEDASKKAAKLTADNIGLCKIVDAKDALVRELRASEAAARDKLADATARLESAQKQTGSLQYEVRMLQKELEVRGREREYDLRAADAARRQQAEHLKQIAQLEAECQRLRAMVRKRLPGPAAIAKMRDEVEQQQQLTPRASPRRSRSSTPSSPRSVTTFTPQRPAVSEAENLAFKLRAVEDENSALKQAIAKRESELQFVQMKYADEACKLTAVQRQLKELTEQNRQLSDANCKSESWASALISELEQLRFGNKNGASIMPSDMSLLDDFAEIEKLEMASANQKKDSPRASPKKAEMGLATLVPEQNGNDLVGNGNVPSGHPETERVQDIWKMVMHKHESSGDSVDTIIEEMRHALDQKTISSTKRKGDSDAPYDRSEVEKVVRNLIEELESSVTGSSAEDNVARCRPLPDKSELRRRLEHMVQVCQDLLHGKVNLEKFVDEVCLTLEYTLSQYFSDQDQSYTVDSETKHSDEGKSLSAINIDGKHNNDTQDLKPAVALDIQEEAHDEPIHQEKLEEETTRCVLDPNDNTLPGRKSTHCEIESPATEASVEDWAPQEEEQMAANSDIQAAADKLAECQETITILSKQLQALAAPTTTSGRLDSQTFDPSSSLTYKPQSLASILAEKIDNTKKGSGSLTLPRSKSKSRSRREQDAPFVATSRERSPERVQNANAEDKKDSVQIVVHPVFVAEPQQENVSSDPGKKKKKRGGSNLLGRIMFRKKGEGNSS